MNDPTPARPATHSPEQASEAPAGVLTDQGAREALVERLAEAIRSVVIPDSAEQLRDLIDALTPVVAAEVEAAVSLTRAEAQATREAFHEARSQCVELRERIARLTGEWDRSAALASVGGYGFALCASDARALLAPSPAEGTSEGGCECGGPTTIYAEGGE